MSLLGKTHIFNELANRLHGVDPSQVRMISDRCLIKDLADAEKEGSIVIPEPYRDRGLNQFGTYRKGIVMSTGPGDRFIEVGIEESGDQAPRVRRKAITRPCICENGKVPPKIVISGMTFDCKNAGETCTWCDGSGFYPICVPPQCQPGDVVIYEKRGEAEFWLNGERYVICNAEQSVIAVLED